MRIIRCVNIMKVVQINSVCSFGSTGRIVVDLSKEMTKSNIENYIIYGIGLSDYPLGIKIGNKIDLRLHQLHTRLLGYHGYASKLMTRKIINKLEEIQPDIIHLHNIHSFYLNIEILFRYLAEINKPVIWTLHDCWAFTGHCPHFDYIHCERWQIGCYNCPQKYSYPISYLFDRSEEQWRIKKKLFTSVRDMCIVTPSHWLAGLVQKSFLKKYDIKIINNGIDLEIFKPTSSSIRKNFGISDKYVILGVASYWGMRKGLLHFIQLSEKLGENYQIILVGLTHKQKKMLPNNIIGITRTNNIQEVVELYSVADVFVNPTLEDNFPTVNLEALACGTPVITFNTGGSPEAIDSTCGMVVEKGNINELVIAIKDICNNSKLNKQKIKENCVERASNFNKEKKFGEYINLYRSR